MSPQGVEAMLLWPVPFSTLAVVALSGWKLSERFASIARVDPGVPGGLASAIGLPMARGGLIVMARPHSETVGFEP